MVFSVQQIKYELLAYIKGLGGTFGDWYVGCASDPEQALFEQHHVRREEDPWIYKPALTGKATFTVVRYFRDVLHTDANDIGEPSPEANFVYAFRKGQATVPCAAK
jgi:hypothetical protein